MRLFYSVGLALLVLASCVGGAGRRASKATFFGLVEDFFINDSTMQYFIKPVSFQNQKDEVAIDFTFRKSKSNFSKCVANFSVIGVKPREATSIDLVSGTQKIRLSNLSMLFKEVSKGKFITRYSSEVAYEDLRMVFDHKIALALNGDQNFTPSKKTVSNVMKIKESFMDFVLK